MIIWYCFMDFKFGYYIRDYYSKIYFTAFKAVIPYQIVLKNRL